MRQKKAQFKVTKEIGKPGGFIKVDEILEYEETKWYLAGDQNLTGPNCVPNHPNSSPFDIFSDSSGDRHKLSESIVKSSLTSN